MRCCTVPTVYGYAIGTVCLSACTILSSLSSVNQAPVQLVTQFFYKV